MATALDLCVREERLQSPKPRPVMFPDPVVIDEFVPGSVLVRQDTRLPAELNLRFGKRMGWKTVIGLNAFGFERRLAAVGWHYFFIVPSQRITRFALSREAAANRALSLALRQVEEQRFNSVEIISLEVRRWLGIYRARLVVNARHVRNSPFLQDPDPYAGVPRVWDFRGLFEKINRDNSPSLKAM